MATDARAQSGIDEVLRSEGLTKDIAEIRRLAQGDFMNPMRGALAAASAVAAVPSVGSGASNGQGASPFHPAPGFGEGDLVVVREREYPTEGADSYAAIPDTSIVYAKGLPVSPHASDPLYVVGDADAPLPEPEPEPEEPLDAVASPDGGAPEAQETRETEEAEAPAAPPKPARAAERAPARGGGSA
jgi:hypothetical protein